MSRFSKTPEFTITVDNSDTEMAQSAEILRRELVLRGFRYSSEDAEIEIALNSDRLAQGVVVIKAFGSHRQVGLEDVIEQTLAWVAEQGESAMEATLESPRKVRLLNPLMLALDVDTDAQAFEIAGKLKGQIGAIKLGPRLNMRYGASLVAKMAEIAPVFVDNKYLDIPNTMESAVRATFAAGASFTTVHAWAGPEALERMAQVEAELNRTRPFQILTVTILTSFNAATLPHGLVVDSIENHVTRLAELAWSKGLTGIVCSPQELSLLRRRSAQAFLVAPGVRMPGDNAGDQKRVETPESAIRGGASAIVVGRPIVEAKDPRAVVEKILESVALGKGN